MLWREFGAILTAVSVSYFSGLDFIQGFIIWMGLDMMTSTDPKVKKMWRAFKNEQ